MRRSVEPVAHPRKAEVREFWDAAACGEVYATGESQLDRFNEQRRARYELEPFIESFARFSDAKDHEVLEIGVGMGADHLRFAEAAPRRLVGLDLTPRAVGLTSERAALSGFETGLLVADAENLPLPDDAFDIVYSWGVLHHSPDTRSAIREVRRVLRPGGVARIMVYQRASIVGALLWLRFALGRGRLTKSLDEIYSEHLESPGTKAYSLSAIRRLMNEVGFREVRTDTQLSPGDLLEGAAGQRHQGPLLAAARAIWPRGLIRRFGRRFGLFLLIEAR